MAPEPTWSQPGHEKVLNKMNIMMNLLILTNAVLVQFCELEMTLLTTL